MYKQHGWVVDTELSILEQLHHPNIIALYEAVETPKFVHLMLEYAGGGSLQVNLTLILTIILTPIRTIGAHR